MGDFYTDNSAALLGKPKATIADYVEQNGILVPRRYATLDDALASGVPIIARSEHPQDYDGVSGLLESPVIMQGQKVTEGDLVAKILDLRRKVYGYEDFCRLTGISSEEFLSQVSASFWEKLKGTNVTLVADSAVSGRYHIIVHGDPSYYIETDNGSIKVFSNQKTRKYLALDVQKLIEFYEKVRTLDKFDTSHSYIMEVQIFDDDIYFLQLHRGRDFKKSKFEIERAPKPGEYEATLVRGCTNPEGNEFKTVVNYGNYELKDVEGSSHLTRNLVFQELMYRRTGLQIAVRFPEQSIAGSVQYHGDLSRMFKPELSLMLDASKFQAMLPSSEFKSLVDKIVESQQDQHITFRVTSDGRKAYISRVS